MTNNRYEINKRLDNTLVLSLSGDWKGISGIPDSLVVTKHLDEHKPVLSLKFDLSGVTGWDTALIAFIINILEYSHKQGIAPSQENLPPEIAGLIKLALAVPERTDARHASAKIPFLELLGNNFYGFWSSFGDLFAFTGELTTAFGRFFAGMAHFRARDFFVILQECSIDALPIVSLISLLIGLILAFVGSIQLQLFGAQIYIANMVGIGIVRSMGAIMTGIIMAGRTGASYAAHIGTMETNEEIDALRTLGISPVEFLVLPRVIALTIAMPLLSLYANIIGILGGFIVGIMMFDINFTAYYNQTINAVRFKDLWIGLIMSTIFGFLVAITGCYKGLRCERSAASVGKSTTSAVVTGIVSIIIATAFITYICAVLGI
jgi:phospholipid/cholesterol/gamma-HCH transport system permease protein